MKGRREEFSPYWLQTGMPSIENVEMPGQTFMFPWDYPWPHQSPLAMWPASNPSGSSALPPALASAPLAGNLDPSSLYWPQTATPTGVSSGFPTSQPTNHSWEWRRQGPASPGWDYSAMPMPSAPSSTSPSAPPPSSWDPSSPSLWHRPVGTDAVFPMPPAQKAGEPSTEPRSNEEVMSSDARNLLPARPRVPFYGPGDVLLPEPEPAAAAPPMDFRTRLRDALSDANVRYYAGPGFYEAIQKLHALTQLLPGSGTTQSMDDGAQAGQALDRGDYFKAAGHLGMGTVNLGLDWLPGGKVLAIPIGAAAKSFPRARVKIAEELEDAGQSVSQVARETGLHRGKEGKWRFEASDAGYHVRPEIGALDAEGYRVAPLFEHHVHPALQEAYPQFAGIKSRLKIDPSQNPTGAFDPRTNTLTVRAGNIKEAEEVGIHELVHPIQEYEGHARGGGVGTIIRSVLKGMSWDDAIKNYARLAGEAEAANAAKRLRWSDEQRRAQPFPETEWPPREHQTVHD